MPENLRDLWPAVMAAAAGLLGWLFGASRDSTRHTAEIAAIHDQLARFESRLAVADASRGDIAQRLSNIEGQLVSLLLLVKALSGGDRK